jgi:hypothetical protein
MFSNNDYGKAVKECLKDMYVEGRVSGTHAYNVFQEYCSLGINLKRMQCLAYNIEGGSLPEMSEWSECVKEMDRVSIDDLRLSSEIINPKVYYSFVSRKWRDLDDKRKDIFYGVGALNALRRGYEWVHCKWYREYPHIISIGNVGSVVGVICDLGSVRLTGPYNVSCLKSMNICSDPGEKKLMVTYCGEIIPLFCQSYTNMRSKISLFLRDPYYNVFFRVSFPSNKRYYERIMSLVMEGCEGN